MFAHGFGIYFSERPEVSTGYTSKDTGGRLIKRPKGKISSMILCKILLGNPGVNSKVWCFMRKVLSCSLKVKFLPVGRLLQLNILLCTSFYLKHSLNTYFLLHVPEGLF